jgi:hypothetical protein
VGVNRILNLAGIFDLIEQDGDQFVSRAEILGVKAWH